MLPVLSLCNYRLLSPVPRMQHALTAYSTSTCAYVLHLGLADLTSPSYHGTCSSTFILIDRRTSFQLYCPIDWLWHGLHRLSSWRSLGKLLWLYSGLGHAAGFALPVGPVLTGLRRWLRLPSHLTSPHTYLAPLTVLCLGPVQSCPFAVYTSQRPPP
jgi:hypothetical protein